MAITPYYATLMDRSDPDCPVRRQAVPSIEELSSDEFEMEDPLCEEKFSPVEGIVHRYPDRVLLLLTRKCSMLVLSVSISRRGSPDSILSPSFISHFITVPSSIDIPALGIITS